MQITNEYYHIYNRGAHKAQIFKDHSDYELFQVLLYVANSSHHLPDRWRNNNPWLQTERDILVNIVAYCLMPNHFHIALKQASDKGIERFIHRLCTAYSISFNFKYDHSGTIFQGQYRSKHIDSDEYMRYLIQYIHLNPYGIEEPELMKTARPEYLKAAIEYSKSYEYSSFKDYMGVPRKERRILASDCC